MNPINWHPHARRNVLLWTIVPATLALAALGGLSLAFAGLPLIALLLVAGYVAFVWFAGHQRLMRQIRAVPTCLPAIAGPIHELCAQGAIPVPELYLSPDPSPNAFAITTRNGSAICVTRGCSRPSINANCARCSATSSRTFVTATLPSACCS